MRRKGDVIARPAIADQRRDEPAVGVGHVAREERPEVIAADRLRRLRSAGRRGRAASSCSASAISPPASPPPTIATSQWMSGIGRATRLAGVNPIPALGRRKWAGQRCGSPDVRPPGAAASPRPSPRATEGRARICVAPGEQHRPVGDRHPGIFAPVEHREQIGVGDAEAVDQDIPARRDAPTARRTASPPAAAPIRARLRSMRCVISGANTRLVQLGRDEVEPCDHLDNARAV